MSDARAIATFAELVAPLSREEFGAMLATRTPHYMSAAGGDGARYAALMDWDGLVSGLRDGQFPKRFTRVYRDRVKLPKMLMNAETIERLLAANGSIIVNSAEAHVPALDRLCTAVANETGEHLSAALVATCGQGGALSLHYDEFDIIVLQIDGTKTWSIREDPVVNPVNAMPIQPSDEATPELFQVRMHPGDWLFVPAGYRHRCDDTESRSLHITILFYPLSPVRTAELLVREMMGNPDDRAPVRVAAADEPEAEAALKQRLIARIEAMTLDELGRMHRAAGAQPERDRWAPGR